MPTIGQNKPALLDQIQTQKPTIDVVRGVLNQYEDLTLNDLRGIISDEMYEILLEGDRNPAEKSLWVECQTLSWNNLPLNNLDDITSALNIISEGINKVTTYKTRFPNSPKISEASTLYTNLLNKREEIEEKKRILIEIEKEENEWNKLDTGNYNSLRTYLYKFPNSVHKNEIDDLMWTNTKNAPLIRNFERYLQDLPNGLHATEAINAINEFS